jgi:hypothetical protein
MVNLPHSFSGGTTDELGPLTELVQHSVPHGAPSRTPAESRALVFRAADAMTPEELAAGYSAIVAKLREQGVIPEQLAEVELHQGVAVDFPDAGPMPPSYRSELPAHTAHMHGPTGTQPGHQHPLSVRMSDLVYNVPGITIEALMPRPTGDIIVGYTELEDPSVAAIRATRAQYEHERTLPDAHLTWLLRTREEARRNSGPPPANPCA